MTSHVRATLVRDALCRRRSRERASSLSCSPTRAMVCCTSTTSCRLAREEIPLARQSGSALVTTRCWSRSLVECFEFVAALTRPGRIAIQARARTASDVSRSRDSGLDVTWRAIALATTLDER